MARLFLLFAIVPIAELALLIRVGQWIGLWPTIGVVLATGLVGATLASREGLRAWHALQVEMWEGRIPGRPILDGLSIFVGGALLLTPGLMTDAVGFALLVKPSRRWIQDRVLRRAIRSVQRPGSHIRMRTWFGWSQPPGADREGGPPGSGREIEVTDRQRSER